MSSTPVLVAYDGRCPSTLRVGDLLAHALGLDVTLATAYRYEPTGPQSGDASGEESQRRFRHAQSLVEQAALGLGAGVQTRTLPAQDASKGIVGLATDLDATAVVVGPDIGGGVTLSLIGSAPCPVVVAPEDPRLVAGALETVGVAYDGSQGSRFALTAATDLAVRTGAGVKVLAVAIDPHHGREIELAAEHAAAGIDRVLTEVEIRYGDTSRELRDASRQLDLLICGSHGRGKIMRGLIGSVSAELIELPNCPVMVVPRGVSRRGGAPLGLATGAAA